MIDVRSNNKKAVSKTVIMKEIVVVILVRFIRRMKMERLLVDSITLSNHSRNIISLTR